MKMSSYLNFFLNLIDNTHRECCIDGSIYATGNKNTCHRQRAKASLPWLNKIGLQVNCGNRLLNGIRFTEWLEILQNCSQSGWPYRNQQTTRSRTMNYQSDEPEQHSDTSSKRRNQLSVLPNIEAIFRFVQLHHHLKIWERAVPRSIKGWVSV